MRYAGRIASNIWGRTSTPCSSSATYLYQDGPRYWYSTQPTVTKVADDRAEQSKRDSDKVVAELKRRLDLDLREKGAFQRVHALPTSGADVRDDMSAALVVLGPEYPYTKDSGNKAEAAAKAILESRGGGPRLFANSLVFLAVDEARLQDLDEAIRRFLAWDSVVADTRSLNLDHQQHTQAENQRKSADSAVASRIPEAYQWLLVPVQQTPQSSVELQGLRLTSQGALAARTSDRLRKEEMLVASFAGTRLRMELDKIPLWRGDYVEIAQLIEDFARYIYLPRLTMPPQVIGGAVRDGLGLLLWNHESFAYADSYDEQAGRFRGLRAGPAETASVDCNTGLLIKPEVAERQRAAEPPAAPGGAGSGPSGGVTPPAAGTAGSIAGNGEPLSRQLPTRFHGSVQLDATRVGRDAGRIAEEVITHLAGLVGAQVTVTLDIQTTVSDGVPDNVVRVVTENGRALKFQSQGFEES